MAFTITVNDDDNHTLIFSKNTLARQNEANVSITVVVPATVFALGIYAYIDFLLPDGTRYYKGDYDPSSGSFTFTLGSADVILDQDGRIGIQFVLRDDPSSPIEVWKSELKYAKVATSANAEAHALTGIPIPTDFPVTFPASNVSVTDAAGYFSSPDVEDVLQEIGSQLVAGTNVDSIDFDTVAGITPSEGELTWDATYQTLALGLPNGVTLQIGEESHIYAKNTSGAIIPDGAVVYISGATGDVVNVELANATAGSGDAIYAIGVATHEIAINGFGFITTNGIVHGVPALGAVVGDKLWLSTTDGQFTTTMPTYPNNQIFVGWCTKVTGLSCNIFVKCEHYQINELNLRTESAYVNVKYPPYPYVGAKGNGTTDDTTTIQNLIDSFGAATEFFFPVGTYKITAPIVINNNAVTLRGSTRYSIIKNYGADNAIEIPDTALVIDNRVTLEKLIIEADTATATVFGLYAEGQSVALTIRDCEFRYHGDAGAYLLECNSVKIYNSRFSSNCNKVAPTKAAGLYLDNCNAFLSSGCIANGNLNGASGVYVNETYGGTFDGSNFEDNDGYGALVYKSTGIVFNAPYVEGNTSAAGIYFHGASGAESKACVVNSGFFNGTDSGSIVTDYAVKFGYAKACVVNGINTIGHNLGSVKLVTGQAVDNIINNILSDDTNAGFTIFDNQGTNTRFNQGATIAETAAARMSNGSLFVDSADHVLKFKDSGGTLRLLY